MDHDSFSDEDFEDFAHLAYRKGLPHAFERWLSLGRPRGEAEALRQEYERRSSRAETGYPPKIYSLPGREGWYVGPLPDDEIWPAYRESLRNDGRLPAPQIELLDECSTKIVAYTPDPSQRSWSCKGLVVGYVQSGKTTNFTAVIAKAVDVGYNLVVVLTGMHNGLRQQTQERLTRDLCERHPDRWVQMTTATTDFQDPSHTLESVLPRTGERKAVLCVVKKNKDVLRKLNTWLSRARPGLDRVKALIIDDEADQASVDTPAINPLIRDILRLLPAHTFIGYTATPFANMLIDPQADDLYPEDFILDLPEPEGYFGSRMIFGRDALRGEDADGPLDGYDMVRIISQEEQDSLRPRKNVPFEPDVPPIMERAILWFWLASAARRSRGDTGHSTMLVHTSMKTSVQQALQAPIVELRDETAHALRTRQPGLLDRFSALWQEETRRVAPSDFGLPAPDFDEVASHLEEVVAGTRVVVDNYRSQDRLDYGDEPVTAIAIGGNRLSRGLTLEGLVVSYFIRAANAYDTLMQMGRWFGFRRGYEDLPRIYMTKELKEYFRHLATVEDEIRLDIANYDHDVMTPLDVGVRIRTHPKLLVTQKLGAARQAYTSYGGRRVQVRYFKHHDAGWLDRNRTAASALVASAATRAASEEAPAAGITLWRGVPVDDITRFLREYESHEDSPDLDRDLILSYISNENRRSSLLYWSVAVAAAEDEVRGTVDLGGRPFGRIVRSRLKDGEADRADIKTLMSKEHRVLDLDIDLMKARRLPEADLVSLRQADETHRDRGLLILYPIDPLSPPDEDKATREPLDAVADVIGMALVFPGDVSRSVQNSYISVDLAARPVEDQDETSEDLLDEDPESEPV